MAGINKEIWIAQIMEGFYAEASFLDYAQDMSEMVEYNTINLADAGVDPDVLVNNVTFPLTPVQRTDSPLALPLDTLTTRPTFVTDVEEMESAYNKMESVLRGHRRALRIQVLRRAAQAFGPASNGTFTPVLTATGAVRADTGRKKLLWEDVARLATAYKNLEVEGKLILVLNPYHVEDLKEQDRNFYKEYSNLQTGQILNREGFIIQEYLKTPTYDGAGVKKALGAAAAPTTDRYSSISFLEGEVMKCDGTVKPFYNEGVVEYQGNVMNFQKRFLALPIRNKYLGAIISGV